MKYFWLIQFPWRKVHFQRFHSRKQGWGGGLRTAASFPEEAEESVVPFCFIVLVKIISVASGCASILGGMVKGVICLPHYSAPKYMPLGANLASAFSHSLWAVLSSLVSQPFPGLDPAKPSRLWLCWIKSSCLGWGAVTMPLPAGMWTYCSLGPWLFLTLTFLQSGLADLCLSCWVVFHFTSTASLPQALPLDSHAWLAILRWHPKATHRDKDGGRLIMRAVQDIVPQDARGSPAGHYCCVSLSQPQPSPHLVFSPLKQQ